MGERLKTFILFVSFGQVALSENHIERTVRHMAGFVGSYERQLDERGRFVLPAKLRDKMSDTVYITRSLVDKCLLLYTEEEWQVLEEQVKNLPVTTNRSAKAFVNLVFGQAAECEIDKQGRIALTQKLLDFGGLQKNVTMVGIGSKMEIWDSDRYEASISEIDAADVLEGIAPFGLNI